MTQLSLIRPLGVAIAEHAGGKSQTHVHVAKMMLQNQKPVNVGDHIPYVITETLQSENETVSATPNKSKSAAERARHPEEIQRSAGVLKPDVEWYLTQQILPPISRLCEPIEGTSQVIIAEKLGLDAAKSNHSIGLPGSGINDNDLVDYKPAYTQNSQNLHSIRTLRICKKIAANSHLVKECEF